MNMNDYPPEIVEIGRARANEALAKAKSNQNARNNDSTYNPEWRQRKTIGGKNYNSGKYENPYAEDNFGKAIGMGLILGLMALIFIAS